MSIDVRAINDMVLRESAFIDPLLHEVKKVIVGQEEMVQRVLIGQVMFFDATLGINKIKFSSGCCFEFEPKLVCTINFLWIYVQTVIGKVTCQCKVFPVLFR